MNDASTSFAGRAIGPDTRRAPTPSLCWVPETRFGTWFLGTQIWSRYVVEVSLQQFARLLPSPLSRPRRVLDAGCGPGVSLPLLDRYFQPEAITALDIDPHEIERSRQQSRHCACRVELVRGDVARLEFPDESMDLILCHQTLHHVVAQEAVLREFHRVLVPGGVLLIAESCRSFILSTPVRALFRHPNEVQKSAAEYQQLLRDAGFAFTTENVDTSSPFWSLPDWGLRARLGWATKADVEPTQLAAVVFKP